MKRRFFVLLDCDSIQSGLHVNLRNVLKEKRIRKEIKETMMTMILLLEYVLEDGNQHHTSVIKWEENSFYA